MIVGVFHYVKLHLRSARIDQALAFGTGQEQRAGTARWTRWYCPNWHTRSAEIEAVNIAR
jgi:hypothetical protein